MANRLILGTVQFGLSYGINNVSGKPGEASVKEILFQAYRSGIRSLDTADAYGNANEIIGSFHRENRTHFLINTKFNAVSASSIREELLRSIGTLGIEQVETYFYHSFKEYASNQGISEELKELKKDKLVKKIGVSVYTNSEFEAVINDPAIDVIQLPFNLLDNKTQRGSLLQEAKTKQKRVQVRSVFLQGLFFKEPDSLPVSLLPLKPYLERLKTLAQKNGLSMESLCLQYVNAQKNIDEIIIGVDSKEQLINNLAALDTRFPQRLLDTIDSIQVKEIALLYPYNWGTV